MNPIKRYFFYKRYKELRRKLKEELFFKRFKKFVGDASNKEYKLQIADLKVKALTSTIDDLCDLVYYYSLMSKANNFVAVTEKEQAILENYLENISNLKRTEVSTVERMERKHGIR